MDEELDYIYIPDGLGTVGQGRPNITRTSPMAPQICLECRVLIPLKRDSETSDGELHASTAWRWLEREFLEHFDGWTKAVAEVVGEWKSSKTGKAVKDVSVQYLVGVPKKQLEKLRSLLRRACLKFAQQRIYLSIAGVIEYVAPL
jgi:hypothetical protein